MQSILVIDDDALVARTIEKVLRINNYKVDTALTGEEAIQKCHEKEYDIVLSDIRMPVMDGFETVIRRIDPHRCTSQAFSLKQQRVIGPALRN